RRVRDAWRARNRRGSLRRQRARTLRVGARAEHDRAICMPRSEQRPRQAAGHSEYGHEYSDHAHEADNDDARRDEPLPNAAKVERGDRGGLSQHCDPPQRPASASTSFMVRTRQSGANALANATSSANPAPLRSVLLSRGSGAIPMLSKAVGNAAAAMPRPTSAAVTHSKPLSAITSAAIVDPPKP